MQWQFTPYSLPLFLVIFVAFALILYIWPHRATPGASALMVMILAAAIWSAGYALELAGTNLDTKLFWAKFQYLGIVTLPVALLAFVLQYTDRDKWMTSRNLALLATIPLVTVALVWTNESHHLIWQGTELDSSGPVLVLDLTYGSWFWVNSIFAYGLLCLATIQLFSMFQRSPQLYRRQAGIILFGASLPWMANAVYLLRIGPIPQLDLTPFAYILSGVAFVIGLFSFHLLDVVPIARRAIIEGMSDGVIVLDSQGRIIDINPAALRLIGRSATELVGQPAAQIFADQAELVNRYHDVTEAHSELTFWSDSAGSRFSTKPDGATDVRRHFELHISPITDRTNRYVARAIVLHDITARKEAEIALHASYEKLETRVQERTQELAQTNEALETEISERKQIEDALRQSETKYRQLVEYAPAGIFEIDFLNQRFISVNDVMCEYTGYSREEFLSLNPFEILTEESRQRFAERLRKILRGEQPPERVEYRIKGKNNREFWVLLNIRWKYTNGNSTGATVVVYDITERKLVEEQIKASLKEKEVMLQEIHHRVKNNLQVISSLLSLQSDYVEDHRVLTGFQDSQDRIRSMALIHEMLYRSENLAQINFAEYIQDLTTYLCRSHNATARGITLNTRTENILLNVDRAVPCGLILNELVSNALKHAFPDGQSGKICIKLQADGPYQARLTVSDDGVGFPANLNFRITSSLGLQLVNTLVDQVEGIIEIERDPTTAISITFATQQDKETQL